MEQLVESLVEVQQDDISLVPLGKIVHDLMNGDNNLYLAWTFAVEAMLVVTQDDDELLYSVYHSVSVADFFFFCVWVI